VKVGSLCYHFAIKIKEGKIKEGKIKEGIKQCSASAQPVGNDAPLWRIARWFYPLDKD
jgi:hypothetical protein